MKGSKKKSNVEKLGCFWFEGNKVKERKLSKPIIKFKLIV
jgi:hypothetical protein